MELDKTQQRPIAIEEIAEHLHVVLRVDSAVYEGFFVDSEALRDNFDEVAFT